MLWKKLRAKSQNEITRCFSLGGIVASCAATVLAIAPVEKVSADVTLNASGATFPAPLYQRWFAEYNKLHPDVRVNYQGVGSGAGIKSFTDGLTDFGASDAAMSDKEIAAVTTGGVLLLPMTAGSIVISYNLPGVTQAIQLPRDVYPAIFLGDIKRWNDPKIVAANPGVTLPDMPITVASRADGSGTTFNFSGHLSAISPEFKTRLGQGKQVKFPGVAGKGNDGVAALIKQTPGTIGYVEYGYAKQTGLPMATLQNQAGKFVAPSPTRVPRPSPRCLFPIISAPSLPIRPAILPTPSLPIRGGLFTPTIRPSRAWRMRSRPWRTGR